MHGDTCQNFSPTLSTTIHCTIHTWIHTYKSHTSFQIGAALFQHDFRCTLKWGEKAGLAHTPRLFQSSDVTKKNLSSGYDLLLHYIPLKYTIVADRSISSKAHARSSSIFSVNWKCWAKIKISNMNTNIHAHNIYTYIDIYMDAYIHRNIETYIARLIHKYVHTYIHTYIYTYVYIQHSYSQNPKAK